MKRRLMAWGANLTILIAVAVPISLVGISPASATENGALSAAISSSWQANATVWGMAYANNEIWLSGDFTSLRPPGSPAGTNEQAHTYLAALNSATGAPVSFPVNHTFTLPSGSSGLPLTTSAVAASPDGSTVYVGGNFVAVDGVTRSHIVAFNTTTGAMTSFAPAVNGKVSAIAAVGSTVYIGGTFTKVGSSARTNVAAVSASTGAVLPWNPAAPNDTVDALATTPDGSTVAIGGFFTAMGGDTSHNKAALVDGTTGAFLPLPADSVVPVNSSSCYSNVKSMVISGGALYVGNEGTGGGCFDGTWAANLSDGSLKWVNTCLGATQSVAVVGNYLYKGSHIHDCQLTNTNGDPDNFPQVPVNHNRHLTTESLSNGFLGPWYPDMNAGPNLGPRVLATDGSQLYVGGDFTVINGTNQQGIARFTSTTDYPTPKPATPVAVSSVAGSANIFAQSPVDLDNPDLTIELFRDSGTTPIATANVHSLFWKQPIVGFTDSGLAPGSQHTYRVEAVPQNGAAGSPLSSASAKVTISSGTSGYQAAVLAQNPAAYWRFGESGGTLAADSSPNLNGGIYTGGVTFGAAGGVGDSNTAATFDGSTGYFTSGTLQPSPTTFSVDAWFKTTTTSGGKIIGFGSSQTGNSSGYDRHIYMTNSGQLVFGTYSGTTNVIQSAKSYNDGNWHQVVGTQGPTGMSLYVDGVKVGSNGTTANQSYMGYWRVGEDNLNGWPNQPSSNYFSGTIDDVSVYNTALTSSQIATQYTAAGNTLPTPPGSTAPYAKAVLANGPTMYWRLDEASGTTATDLSGNSFNGTYGAGDTLGTPGAISDGTTPADTAITTDGNDDGVMVSQGQQASLATFSLEAWFKTTHAGGKIIGFGDSASATGSSNYDKHIYFNSDGSLNFGVWNGHEDVITAPASLHLTDGNWHHVVATQDSSGMKLYVDGNLVASNAVTTNQTYAGYWHVGGDSGWSNNGNDFNGSIDEVAVYPYALTGAQVLADYQIGTGQSTTPAPPVAPATPTVTSSSSTTADISFSAVAGATSYQVQRSISGANSFSNDGPATTALTLHDTGLTPGASYDYQVIASNAGGSSSPSPIATVTLVPSQPGTLTATTNGTGEVDLSWGGATGATSYDVRRGVVGSGVFGTDLGQTSATAFAVTGLNPGDSFDYEVVPSDTAGNGAPSNTVTGTTLPAQVTGLSATAISAGEIDLSWSAATGATSYTVERSPTGAGTFSAISTGGTATSFNDTTVSPATGYDYRVVAVGVAGKGAYSTIQTATTPVAAPGQVTGLTAAAASPTEIDLTWTATPGATSYEVDRSSVGPSSGFAALSTTVTSASYADKTASPSTPYWYQVIASNSAGPGPASSAATATTPATNTPLLANGFEGGTNGSAITIANSGGASGAALNNVSCASGTATYSNSSPAHGGLAALLAPTTKTCYVEWNSKAITATTSAYGRAYVNFAADPAGAIAILKGTDASFNRDVQVNLAKTGKLSILDANGTTQATFTQPIPLNQWVRLEWHLVAGSSGSFELRVYAGDSTTPIESHVVTGIATGTSIGAVQVGALSSVAAGLGTTIGLDDLAYGTAGWLGPAS